MRDKAFWVMRMAQSRRQIHPKLSIGDVFAGTIAAWQGEH
jgi:hypothetical protein